jgi:cobalt-zinc-cadmium efflux system outer membrane protein
MPEVNCRTSAPLPHVSRPVVIARVVAVVLTATCVAALTSAADAQQPAVDTAGRVAAALPAPSPDGQPTPLTLAAAEDAALASGPHAALARADALVARAALVSARELPNPVANLSYTRDTPHYHGILNLPFDYPWVRGARVHAAQAGYRSASYRYAFERAAVRFEVDTTYTRALAAAAHGRVSQHNATDADSLRRLAVIRREAGDASDMDVELATVNAGQLANVAAADSLAAVSALLDLQAIVGLPSDRVAIALADSIVIPEVASGAGAPAGAAGAGAALGTPAGAQPDSSARPAPGVTAPPQAGPSGSASLQVAAAEAALASEESSLALARRTVLAQPALTAGLEGGDPTQRYLLPTVGLSIPFPLFNHGGGEIALATANRDRAAAELDVARRESVARIAQTRRELAVAVVRASRDRDLLVLAGRVVARSLTAFAEGATALPSVLEAQRSARDALSQYVDDLAAANTASAAVRLFTLTASSR